MRLVGGTAGLVHQPVPLPPLCVCVCTCACLCLAAFSLVVSSLTLSSLVGLAVVPSLTVWSFRAADSARRSLQDPPGLTRSSVTPPSSRRSCFRSRFLRSRNLLCSCLLCVLCCLCNNAGTCVHGPPLSGLPSVGMGTRGGWWLTLPG